MGIYRKGAPLKTTPRSKIMMMKGTWKMMIKELHDKLPKENINFFLKSLASGRELDLTDNPSVSKLAQHLLFAMPNKLRSKAAGNIKPNVNEAHRFSRFENEHQGERREAAIPPPDFGIS